MTNDKVMTNAEILAFLRRERDTLLIKHRLIVELIAKIEMGGD
jgi:hypothetical protein